MLKGRDLVDIIVGDSPTMCGSKSQDDDSPTDDDLMLCVHEPSCDSCTLKTRQRFWHHTVISTDASSREFEESKKTHRSMWETTYARNTQAGVCKDFTTVSYTKEYVRFVIFLTKSGLGIARICFFPHGHRSNQ